MQSRWHPCACSWDHQNSSNLWQSSLLHSASYLEWLAVKYRLSMLENMSQNALKQADAWIWCPWNTDEILALVLEIINIHQTRDRKVFNTLPAIRNWLAVKYRLSMSENMSQNALEQADAWIWSSWNTQVPSRWDPCTYVWDHQNLSNTWQSSLLHSASYLEVACTKI